MYRRNILAELSSLVFVQVTVNTEAGSNRQANANLGLRSVQCTMYHMLVGVQLMCQALRLEP